MPSAEQTTTTINAQAKAGIETADASTPGVAESKRKPSPGQQASSQANDAFRGLITKSAPGADVFIMEPGDGSTVSSPLTVKFGITNMTLAKAGDNVDLSGHHHLLIDVDELPSMTAPLPASEKIIHFGGAQTETTVELTPGQHTLQLILGNYLHIPHDTPVMSKKITITVE